MKCQECGKEFEPLFTNVAKGYGKFCSTSCYHTYHGKAMKSGEHKCPKPKKIYKFTCVHCGKEFERDGHTKHRNKYCSSECSQKHRVGSEHPKYNQHPTTCTYCGKEMMRSPSYIKGNSWGNFCSTDCKAKWQSEHINGSNHPQWQGGKSFEPYCPLFNDSFKERVRAFFDYKCVLCGAEQAKEKHHVHHVEYNKSTCCDESPKIFVSLCRSCHTKTNHNRDAYPELFKKLVEEQYHGRSYFTQEEWNELHGTTPTA